VITEHRVIDVNSPTCYALRQRRWRRRRRWRRPELTAAIIQADLVVGMRENERVLVAAQKYSLVGLTIYKSLGILCIFGTTCSAYCTQDFMMHSIRSPPGR